MQSLDDLPFGTVKGSVLSQAVCSKAAACPWIPTCLFSKELGKAPAATMRSRVMALAKGTVDITSDKAAAGPKNDLAQLRTENSRLRELVSNFQSLHAKLSDTEASRA